MLAQDTGPFITPFDALADFLEIPDSAYETASARYMDLGDWLHDASRSSSASFSPTVFPQGSFRLGTAIRPWKRDHFDLDLTCVLADGVSMDRWTQRDVKDHLGRDLEDYRRERGIREHLEEKHRCWRLNYQDAMTFHMDIVPAIPQTQVTQSQLSELMVTKGVRATDAMELARYSIAITDDRHPEYETVSYKWLKSNPEGFARWFEGRMRQAEVYLRELADRLLLKSVEALPTYLWKTPLQRSVQILKRHRDVMFEQNPDVKPPSVIISTLAARGYGGEVDLGAALRHIVETMDQHIAEASPRVPNPVNPEEDFADRWGSPEGRRLDLEGNFRRWLEQAKIDVELYGAAESADAAAEQAALKFGANVDRQVLARAVGLGAVAAPLKAVHHLRRDDVPKPWRSK